VFEGLASRYTAEQGLSHDLSPEGSTASGVLLALLLGGVEVKNSSRRRSLTWHERVTG
jgi:hypothetical protein